MDGLSAAASVIALIQLTELVFSLCRDYILSTKEARRDIELICGEVTALHDVLDTLDGWLQGSNDPSKFSILKKIQAPAGVGPLEVCQRELQEIRVVLEKYKAQPPTSGASSGVGTSSRMRRFGGRALKWPFDSKDVKARKYILNLFSSPYDSISSRESNSLYSFQAST
jgi:ankyrin repeat domain-containing protein 50